MFRLILPPIYYIYILGISPFENVSMKQKRNKKFPMWMEWGYNKTKEHKDVVMIKLR